MVYTGHPSLPVRECIRLYFQESHYTAILHGTGYSCCPGVLILHPSAVLHLLPANLYELLSLYLRRSWMTLIPCWFQRL